MLVDEVLAAIKATSAWDFSAAAWQTISFRAKRPLARMMSVKPTLRPMAAQVVEDLWFRDERAELDRPLPDLPQKMVAVSAEAALQVATAGMRQCCTRWLVAAHGKAMSHLSKVARYGLCLTVSMVSVTW